jgi:hypothetical protein
MDSAALSLAAEVSFQKEKWRQKLEKEQATVATVTDDIGSFGRKQA